MKTLIKLLLIVLLIPAVSSCGNGGKFTVDGTVEGGRTMNMRIVYNGEDNVNNILTAARDGKFQFTGYAPDKRGVLVEFLDNDYRVMGRLYAENGDKIKITVNADDRTAQSVEGNDLSERLSKWLNDNADCIRSRNAREINAAVARYARANPEDLLSGILMATEYNASIDITGAEKLLTELKPEARPSWLIDGRILTEMRLSEKNISAPVTAITYLDRHDSIVTFRPKESPRSILAFTGDNTGRADSILRALKSFHKEHSKVEIIDFWLETDTFTWRRTLRRDSVNWKSGWAAGSVGAPSLEQLAIPSLPYFVVTDSTGRQLYRGPSVSLAISKAGD